jgi:lipocalin
VQARYSRNSDNNIDVKNSQRKPGETTILPARTVTGYPKNDKFPVILVSFFYIDRNEYEIISTDHTNYAVVRSCSNFVLGIFHEEVFWILLRSSTTNPALIANAK